MTLEESVASMSREQIAESLDLTPKCLAWFEEDGSFPEERSALHGGSELIRNGASGICTRKHAIEYLSKNSKQLEPYPQWRKRCLVYKRALEFLEAS